MQILPRYLKVAVPLYLIEEVVSSLHAMCRCKTELQKETNQCNIKISVITKCYKPFTKFRYIWALGVIFVHSYYADINVFQKCIFPQKKITIKCIHFTSMKRETGVSKSIRFFIPLALIACV